METASSHGAGRLSVVNLFLVVCVVSILPTHKAVETREKEMGIQLALRVSRETGVASADVRADALSKRPCAYLPNRPAG